MGPGSERLVVRPVPMGLGRARPEDMTRVTLSILTTCGRGQRGQVQYELGSSRRRRPRWPDPRPLKLALGMWNVTSLLEKEPELVHEAERFRLDIVGFTLTQSLGSRTSLFDGLDSLSLWSCPW